MKFSIKKLNLRVLLIFAAILLNSCSKDSDDPTPQETPITVSTADFSKTMDENPTTGQVIGTIVGSTNEGSVTFSIIEQTPSGAFSIDSASGELKVADETLFDFETNPTITGTVKVANGTVSKNALVTITLNDLVEENVYDGDIVLRSQQEVDDFGSHNYTRINGLLVIGKLENEGFSDITDLTPLLSLKHIEEYLHIQYNGVLTTTSGLENILYLGNNFALLHNPSIVNLVSLNNIQTIPGILAISDNPALSNLDGLSNITNVGEYLYISGDKIPNLDWLSNLLSVGGDLSIINNPLITNLNGMSNLTSIGGGLIIDVNNSLLNLSGFQNLTGTIKGLSLRNNNSLSSIDGIANISITGGLGIYNNPVLENLNALLNTTYLSGTVLISNNDSLINLNGLNNLTSIGIEMDINDNDNLTSLDGLNNLLYVSLTISITHNTLLSDFCDLQNLFINGQSSYFRVFSNAYNPTKQDIIDGNCSL